MSCLCLLGKILDEIDEHGIKIYHLPDAESDEDEDFKEQTRILKVNSPFPAKPFIPQQIWIPLSQRQVTVLSVTMKVSFISQTNFRTNHPILRGFVLSVMWVATDTWTTPLFQASIPFAVVGSNQQIEAKGKKVRGRLYPWGVVEVENPEHNDFLKLRIMLMWVVDETHCSPYSLKLKWSG